MTNKKENNDHENDQQKEAVESPETMDDTNTGQEMDNARDTDVPDNLLTNNNQTDVPGDQETSVVFPPDAKTHAGLQKHKTHRPDAVIIIGIYHILLGLPLLLVALATILFALPPIVLSDMGAIGLIASISGVTLGLLLIGGSGLLLVVAGWGLISMKDWTRWLVIAFSMISLLAVPIGTIIGGIIIYYLLKHETRALFVQK